MMTIGRLRAIESYVRRDRTDHGMLFKCGNELVAEVKRLREVLATIAETDCHPSSFAAAALREPDLGPPDIVCRRDGSGFDVVQPD